MDSIVITNFENYLADILSRNNILIVGKTNSGKTFLMNKVYEVIKNEYIKVKKYDFKIDKNLVLEDRCFIFINDLYEYENIKSILEQNNTRVCIVTQQYNPTYSKYFNLILECENYNNICELKNEVKG